jgi:hypothetical protein
MGKGASLSKMEMRNLLVYNLRWFGPDEGDRIIKAAISSGLVQSDSEGSLNPTFDMSTVEVEVDYEPAKNLDTEKLVRPLFERLIESITSTGLDRKEAVRIINRKAEELNLLFPCAAIFVGIERGANMSMFYSEVENSIRFGER